MNNIYLPKDTFDALEKNGYKDIFKGKQCENIKLMIDKYPYHDMIYLQKELFDTKNDNFNENEKKTRNKIYKNVFTLSYPGYSDKKDKKYKKRTSFVYELKYLEKVKHFSYEVNTIISKLGCFYEMKHLNMQQKDKMVVGLGESNVYENAITLHHIYGFPYVPGQAVKGTLRNYYINKNFDKLLSKYLVSLLSKDSNIKSSLKCFIGNDETKKNELEKIFKLEFKSSRKALRTFSNRKEYKSLVNKLNINIDKMKNLINEYNEYLNKCNEDEKSKKISFENNNDVKEIITKMSKNFFEYDKLYDFMKTKADEVAEEDEKYKFIFGTQEQQGKVIFFDAMPTKFGSLEVDIMNNHYQDYYAGDEYPTDDMQPNPVTFLVAKGFSFYFSLGFKKGNDKKENVQKNKTETVSLEDIKNELKECLINHGIGAKTAVGYGYFQEYNQKNEDIQCSYREERLRIFAKDIEDNKKIEKEKKKTKKVLKKNSKVDIIKQLKSKIKKKL